MCLGTHLGFSVGERPKGTQEITPPSPEGTRVIARSRQSPSRRGERRFLVHSEKNLCINFIKKFLLQTLSLRLSVPPHMVGGMGGEHDETSEKETRRKEVSA